MNEAEVLLAVKFPLGQFLPHLAITSALEKLREGSSSPIGEGGTA